MQAGFQTNGHAVRPTIKKNQADARSTIVASTRGEEREWRSLVACRHADISGQKILLSPGYEKPAQSGPACEEGFWAAWRCRVFRT
jgi:hypothetical protein